MATMDVFNNSVFSATSLAAAVDKMGYTPSFLRTLPGLVRPVPVRTEAVWIEEQTDGPLLIQTSPRGSAPARRDPTLRAARGFKTVRIAKSSRIHASELQGIRAFGSETELMGVQKEVASRLLKLRNDAELTFENYILGMTQGTVLDADGTTLFAWATEFGQTIPAEVDFDLDNGSPASGVVRKACAVAVRSVTRGLKGLGGAGVGVIGLCGDAFWDDLIAHPEVRETYKNQAEAAQLRGPSAWESLRFGGITFINYRGTDDGTTVAIGTDKCKFFPTGADIFQMAYAPHESFDFVNTPGQESYAMIVPDKDRNMFVDVEYYSYPLPVCTMPQALYRAKRT